MVKAIDIQAKRKKRFSDFAKERVALDGEKVSIDAVLNQEIEITGYRTSKSKYTKNNSGKCLTLQFVDPMGEKHVLFTGSDVLISQLGKYGEEIPFLATIKKVDRYYTLS